MKKRLNIGIIGVQQGNSSFVNKLIDSNDLFRICGFYETSTSESALFQQQFSVTRFEESTKLIAQSEAVLISKSTSNYSEFAKEAIRMGKHVIMDIHHILSHSTCKEITKLAEEAGVIVQITGLDRSQTLYQVAKKMIFNPLIFEIQRNYTFDSRNSNSSFIHHSLLNSIDMVVHSVQSNIKKTSSKGIAFFNRETDVISSRIEFDNGCVANINASRVAKHQEATMTVHQNQNFLRFDFDQQEVEKTSIQSGDNQFLFSQASPTNVRFDVQQIIAPDISDETLNELKSFWLSVTDNQTVIVSIEQVLVSLGVAVQIADQLKVGSLAIHHNK